jgi:hypothetical protein
MRARLSFVTLGVEDVARARAFYEALGFKASAVSNPNVTFFDAGGIVLSLFGRKALAADAAVKHSRPGFSGVALAHNVSSDAEVDQVLDEAVRAGATLLKPGQKAFWGGYSGYFADPDGHIWEVAHNPFFPLDAAGHSTLPPPVNHDHYTDAYIAGVLKSARVFAVVGASAKPDRPSYGVMEFLIAKGFKVIPVNPGHAGEKILGQRVVSSLADARGAIDVVDIFRNSDAVPAVVAEALEQQKRLKLKAIWMQIGVRHDRAAAEAQRAGLKVIMDRCPHREINRLGL